MHSGSAISRHQLGTQLRQLRQAQSLRLETAAARLGIAASTLSRIETGRAPTKLVYLHALLDLYGLDDQERRKQLTEMAMAGQHKEWWADHGGLLPAATAAYLGLEATAMHVRGFTAHAVPALLQTPAYAKAFFKASRPELDAAGISRLVRLQIRRQLSPDQSDRRIDLILDEAALLRSVGTKQVMADQLGHLRTVADDPSLTVRVIRFAATRPVLCPAFTLLELPGTQDPDIACFESIGGHVDIRRHAAEVADLRTMFKALASSALSPASSAKLIGTYADHCRTAC